MEGLRVRVTYDFSSPEQLSDWGVYDSGTAAISIVNSELQVEGLSGVNSRAAILQAPVRVDRLYAYQVQMPVQGAVNVFLNSVIQDLFNPPVGYSFTVRENDLRIFVDGVDNNFGGPGSAIGGRFDLMIRAHSDYQLFSWLEGATTQLLLSGTIRALTGVLELEGILG